MKQGRKQGEIKKPFLTPFQGVASGRWRFCPLCSKRCEQVRIEASYVCRKSEAEEQLRSMELKSRSD